MKSLRILIVDDDPLLRMLIPHFLGNHEGVQVIGVAESSTEGLEKARTSRPDIIFLDIQLPDGDPETFIQTVQTLAPSTKVYLCSAYPDDKVETMVKRAHADGFVSKTNLKEGLAAIIQFLQKQSG